MLYGCQHFSTLFLTVSQIPQHTVSADQWEARLYHLLFWEKAIRTKRHTQFRGCSRNTEVHAHAAGSAMERSGNRVDKSTEMRLLKGGNGVLTWRHSFQAQVSLSAALGRYADLSGGSSHRNPYTALGCLTQTRLRRLFL